MRSHRSTAQSVLRLVLVAASLGAGRPVLAQGVKEFVYAVGDAVSGYVKNPATGALSPVPGSPFGVGARPAYVVVDPSNRFVYVANSDSHSISAFTINATTGTLTSIPGSPFAEVGDPEWLLADVTGQFLYVADPLFEKIKGYRINSTTGALTPLTGTGFAVANNVNGMAQTPSGRFLYAATSAEGPPPTVSRIYGFAADASTGVLTPVAGSPWLVGTGRETRSLVVDPTSRFLYGANEQSNDIVGYAITAATGALTPLASGPVATGNLPAWLVMSPSGKFLYAANQNGWSLSGYAVSTSTGALTPLPGFPISTTTPGQPVIDASGQLLYLPDFGAPNIVTYSLDSTSGALSPHGPPTDPFSAQPMAATHFGAVAPPVTLVPLITSNVPSPVAITNAHDGSGRLFVTLQDGRVMMYDGCGLHSTPFLDIRTLVLSGGEQGLLSVAFHPAFPATPYFYVYYTRQTDGAIVVARYRVSAGDPNVADATSGVVLIVIPHPTFANHNGGQLQFGPDGYLYFATGDGGSGFDPSCNSQRTDVLLGKMMRVDVNQNFNTPPYYGIPPSNPFLGPGNPPHEVWSTGLRNPYRFSFDRLLGDLFIGDVGQNTREEVDVQPPGAGGRNYGWKIMEGTLCLGDASGCPGTVPGCGSPAFTAPVLDYGHTAGRCSITGGYRYRGTGVPGLAGAYVYADYCTGEIFVASQNGAAWTSGLLVDAPYNVSAFGEDEQGELYVANYSGNAIDRIVTTGPTADLSIAKTDGQTTAVAGTPVTYTITAGNAGPTTAYGATVADTFPAALGDVNWTCAAAGGASCCSIVSGDTLINRPVLLPPGGTVTYTATGLLASTATGTLSNTATVSAPASLTDPAPANNSVTDTDTVVSRADLSITKTDGHAAVLAGQAITYTIVATNAGPSLTGATVTDAVPAALTGATWTCAGSGGGVCTGSGAGSINDAVTLPVGASVTYALSGTVSPSATGTLANTAQVAATGGTVDPHDGDDAATDSDPVVVPAPHNDVPESAKDVDIGAVSTDSLGPSPDDHNWFRYNVRAGRSYCVEVDNGRGEVSIRDTVLGVYHADATTVIGGNDDISDEPGAALLSRVCYVATADEDNLADVTAGAGGTPGGFRLRVVETTLFSPWFFSGGGFEAFVLIRNTTGTAHAATVTLSSADGTTAGPPQTSVVPANGSYNLQVSAPSPAGFGLATASGGVYIAHEGPPGSLIANVTSLSFGSGVSFDTPASPRQAPRP